jgi:hypothetical protein
MRTPAGLHPIVVLLSPYSLEAGWLVGWLLRCHLHSIPPHPCITNEGQGHDGCRLLWCCCCCCCRGSLHVHLVVAMRASACTSAACLAA